MPWDFHRRVKQVKFRDSYRKNLAEVLEAATDVRCELMEEDASVVVVRTRAEVMEKVRAAKSSTLK